jgi:hypothetical protein
MTTPAWVKEQRPNGYARALLTLADTLARHSDESVHVTGVYRKGKWWRVTVRVGLVAAEAPRFVAFDDATSYRLGALAMATSKEG